MGPTRLLLINPRYGASFWGFDHAMDLMGRSYSNAPLALVTVAALCPDGWEVTVADENVRPVDLDAECDVVGITAMNVQAERAFALAAEFKRRGRTVIMGGPFATLEPERCKPHVDVLFEGECEQIFPRFCADFAADRAEAHYVERGSVDVATSPVPRYDLLERGAYAAMPIQSSRGCPFGCEFCDIIVMQGRKVRSKPPEQILREVAAIEAVGGDSIFFTDDNFIGSPKRALAICEGLVRRRKETGYAPLMMTQASLNLAEQPRLLAEMVRAGFTRVFLGIETPRQTSLRETNKLQNVRGGDMLERIHSIQRAGLITWAGMIVGFDHDDPEIFAEQAEFLDQAGIAVAMVGMLNAPPRTPLFARLKEAGRLHATADWADNCAWTNIIPAQMTRAELFRGYGELVTELYDQDRYARRLLANISRMEPPERGDAAARLPNLADIHDLWRAVKFFTFSRSPARRRHFVPNLLRVLTSRPHRAVEAAIHLGIWSHFERYVPDLVAKLDAAPELSGRVEALPPQARLLPLAV